MAGADITRLLREAEAGREGAMDELMVEVYSDLKRMAESYLRKQFGDHAKAISLEPAALVNESFLKLIRQRSRFDNREHFFAIASRSMLRVLIDYRRRRDAAKRGGAGTHITLVLDERKISDGQTRTEVIEVEQLSTVLDHLETLSPRKADVVRLRVIWGLDLGQVAVSLDVSRSTVERDWRFAKAWLAEQAGTVGC